MAYSLALVAVTVAPSQGQIRRLSISGGNCDEWVPVLEEQCPMAYSLAFSGGIESPYDNVCNDDALGNASLDKVAPMYVETETGDVITCRNAHACIGCPAFAPLLRSCPLLGEEGESLGAKRKSSGSAKRKSSGSAKRKSSGSAKGKSSGSAKRKRRSAPESWCQLECYEEDLVCRSECSTAFCRFECEVAYDI